ncbi:MFS transporter [Kocuria sp. cx-455]|uniref:MFS transporter n=1 Tax=Kocuria sp. cx-455 TaxID=2771377 RepID=UPI00168220CA|nr:MFS transporter [Kocuria sp. cx-455]MBD2763808.1 MFS transporter [Kocuria sp. cx-455]
MAVAAAPSAKDRHTKLVQEVIDEAPMNGRRALVVVLCFVIALLDGFDTQSIAFIGPAIAADFEMGTAELTWVITASTIGMALGAMTLGSLGDKIGRKKAVLIALGLFGVFSILGSMAPNPETIIGLRFLIGLGMGGATPSLLALVAEYSPLRRRGTFMTLVILGLPGGALLGGLVAAAWLPAVGWRGIFLIGGVLPLILLVVSVFFLPESPGYVVGRGTEQAQARGRALIEKMTRRDIPADVSLRTEKPTAKQGSVAGLLSGEYRKVTIAVWAVYLFNWIAWFLLLQWMPSALHALGLPTSTAALGTVTVNGAFIVFAIPLSIVLPRVNPRSLLLGMFGIGILVAVGLGLAGSSWTWVFILLALAGFGIGGQQLVLNYLIANAYPTSLRSTATGWAIGIGRLGSIVGSALGGWLLATFQPGGYFMVLAIPLVIAAGATFLVSKRQASLGS